MEQKSKYLEYLENHPALINEFNQIWIERYFIGDNIIKESIAHFYVYKFTNKYIGILESERPNTSTYIYIFPSDYINLCCYIYQNDLGNPYINRDYTDEEMKELDEIYKLENHVAFKCELDNFTDNHYKPLKYKDYFQGEIKHIDFEYWSEQIELAIQDHIIPDNRKIHKVNKLDYESQLYTLSIAVIERQETSSLIQHLLKQEKGKSEKIKQEKQEKKKNKSSKQRVSIKDLYNKKVSEISKICNIKEDKLIHLLNYKNNKNITSNYIVSDYDIDIFKNHFTEWIKEVNADK